MARFASPYPLFPTSSDSQASRTVNHHRSQTCTFPYPPARSARQVCAPFTIALHPAVGLGSRARRRDPDDGGATTGAFIVKPSDVASANRDDRESETAA
jgi:hypothetical protein